MRSVLALLRAAWLTALSYRVASLVSIAGLLASVVPIYFIANALQPIAAESIRAEGSTYFGFIIVGIAATYVIMSAVSAIPGTLAGSIGSGTFESLLATRTSLPVLLAGLAAYPMVQSLIRAALLLAGAAVIGVDFAWRAMPVVALLWILMVIAYVGISLVASALVLLFRTSGPLTTAVIAASGLLGGVYYSTAVIPGWLSQLSNLVPLTYALRATRMLLLGGARWREVGDDATMLMLIAVTSLAIGALAFGAALRRSRTAGTLSQY
jgi:ABC-2 type transport system permease protein